GERVVGVEEEDELSPCDVDRGIARSPGRAGVLLGEQADAGILRRHLGEELTAAVRGAVVDGEDLYRVAVEGLLLDGADRLPDVVDGVVHRDDHGHSDGHANSLRLSEAHSVGDDGALRDLSALVALPMKASATLMACRPPGAPHSSTLGAE